MGDKGIYPHTNRVRLYFTDTSNDNVKAKVNGVLRLGRWVHKNPVYGNCQMSMSTSS